MEKENNEKVTTLSEVPKCIENPESEAASNGNTKTLPQLKKSVRAIPDSLLRGAKSSTAKSFRSTQKPPIGNRSAKNNAR